MPTGAIGQQPSRDNPSSGGNLPLLREGAERLGLRLSDDHLAAFGYYLTELRAANARFNLTAITDPDEIQVKHFLDSLTPVLVLPPAAAGPLRIIDVGSGAGFPGLPLKLVRPDLELVLLDSSGKKVAFTEHMIRSLDVQDTTAIAGRAEEVARQEQQREAYDVGLARAVAALPVLCEYVLPLVRVGGFFVAFKTSTAAVEETEAARRALAECGGALREIIPVEVPGLLTHRALVVMDKVAPTPARYPRRAGIPAQRPL